METWMTIAAAVAAAVAYFTVRFFESRRELGLLQKADLVSYFSLPMSASSMYTQDFN